MGMDVSVGQGHVHAQAAALPRGTVLTVSAHSRPGHSPATGPALLCLCQLFLCYLSSRFLYYTALDCYIFNQK